MTLWIEPSRPLRGELRLPGDKSITHRALFLAASGSSPMRLRGALAARDTLASLRCLRACGLELELDGDDWILRVDGEGPRSPGRILDAGNSGTTARLLAGFLASRGLEATVDGDASLRRRPMGRIVAPLQEAGARIRGFEDDRYLPLHVRPSSLCAIRHDAAVASAQVKTALLLAALAVHGSSILSEPLESRDHTERLFRASGIRFSSCRDEDRRHVLRLDGPQTPRLDTLEVPGDLSSAAPFLVAAACLPGSDLLCRDLGVNPTRRGVIDVLRRMGASIELSSLRETEGGEPVADLRIRSAPLRSTTVAPEEFPRLLDEIPLLVLAAAKARGTSRFRGLDELRHKECDRLAGTMELLEAFGVPHDWTGKELVVRGPSPFAAAACRGHGDHRMVMAAVVGAMLAEGACELDDASSLSVSFPGFFHSLSTISNALDGAPAALAWEEREREKLKKELGRKEKETQEQEGE